MTVLKKVVDMKAGQLYIMQYNDSYFKVGRTVDVKKRLQSYPTGTQLHFTCLTSDMRRAEASMLASLRSLEAVSEGIEAQPNCGKETFRGPFAKIARRVTAAAQEFPAEPHNMMSVEAARAWYDGRDGDTGTSFTQFLIDNECVTLINNQSTRPRPIARRLYRIKRACPAINSQVRVSDVERGSALMQNDECAHLINDKQCMELVSRKRRGEQMTDREEQQLWVYHMVVERYHLYSEADGKIDREVLDKYIGPCCPQTGTTLMLRQYYALKRLHKLCKSTVIEVRDGYLCDLLGIDTQLHETKLHNFYKPLIEVGELLEQLVPQWRTRLDKNEVLPVSNMRLVKKLVTWLENMSDDKYVDLMDVMGIELRSDSAKHKRSTLIAALTERSTTEGLNIGPPMRPGRTATELLEKLLGQAFGLCLVPARLSKKGYRDIDPALYTNMMRRRNKFEGLYSFINDEDPKAPDYKGLPITIGN